MAAVVDPGTESRVDPGRGSQVDRAALLNRVASVAIEKGKLSHAVQVLQTALALDPGNAKAWYNLGLALSTLAQQGARRVDRPAAADATGATCSDVEVDRLSAALRAFLTALKLDNDFEDAANNAAALCIKLDRAEEAVALCETALHIRFTFPGAHYNLNTALRCAGRQAEAVSRCWAALARAAGTSEREECEGACAAGSAPSSGCSSAVDGRADDSPFPSSALRGDGTMHVDSSREPRVPCSWSGTSGSACHDAPEEGDSSGHCPACCACCALPVVVCVKWGTKYGPEYVNRLAAAVAKWTSAPHRFVCLTDDATGLNAEVRLPVIPPPPPSLPLPCSTFNARASPACLLILSSIGARYAAYRCRSCRTSGAGG